MDTNNLNKGLGDRVEDAIKKTGLNMIAEAYTKFANRDCGCNKRKQTLNDLFPGSSNIRHYAKKRTMLDVPGQPSRIQWYSVKGIDNDIVKLFLKKAKKLNWGEHQLWLVGGILNDWFTKDIDCVITGPYDPEKIHNLQFDLIKIGFNVGLYPDVIYMDENWDPMQAYNKWFKEGEVTKQKWYYSYNLSLIDTRYYDFESESPKVEKKDGFWIKTVEIPWFSLRKKWDKREYKVFKLRVI